MKLNVTLFFFLIFNSPFAFSQDLEIGAQIWSANDLNVTNYRNGDPIIKAQSSPEWHTAWKAKQGAYCIYNNQTFYNWYAVNDQRGLAPQGYHIPSVSEWLELLSYLGGIQLPAGVLQKSGFFTKGTGSRDPLTGFNGYEKWSCWWSSEAYNSEKAYKCITYITTKGAHVTHLGGMFESGMAIRCIRSK